MVATPASSPRLPKTYPVSNGNRLPVLPHHPAEDQRQVVTHRLKQLRARSEEHTSELQSLSYTTLFRSEGCTAAPPCPSAPRDPWLRSATPSRWLPLLPPRHAYQRPIPCQMETAFPFFLTILPKTSGRS